MEKDSWLINHRIHIKKESKEIVGSNYVKIYIFGSAISSSSPNDIDLLIVYNKNATSYSTLSLIKGKFINELSKRFKLEVDVCTLSDVEAKESNFIEEEGAIRIL